MSERTRLSDRLGGDRRAIFFVVAAAVCAAMIPLTPTDPAKIDKATGAIEKPAYSYVYVPIVLICWCLGLAVLSWLDNRSRQHQSLPIQAKVDRGAAGVNGLAIASVAVGVPALALFGTLGLGAWGVGSALAVVYGETARRETTASGQKGRALAIVGTVVGVVGSALLLFWVARWLGHSLDTAFEKLRNGEL